MFIANLPQLPAWASGTSGLASRTEPVQAYKNSGLQPNTSLPAQYVNWQWGQSYDALTALKRYTLDYSWPVVDDFCRSPNLYNVGAGAAGSTSLAPNWMVKSGFTTQDASGCAVGVFALQGVGQADSALTTAGGSIGPSTDFYMSWRMRGATWSPSYYNFQAGMPPISGVSGICWFGHTGGATNPVHFAWVPSGRGATSINISATAFSPTSYMSYCVERQGSTLAIQYPVSTGQGYVYMGAVLNPINEVVFGVGVGSSGQSGLTQVFIDSARYGVARGD